MVEQKRCVTIEKQKLCTLKKMLEMYSISVVLYITLVCILVMYMSCHSKIVELQLNSFLSFIILSY